jgi:hypothetical protein
MLPCKHLDTDENDDPEAPKPFTERLMQVHLARFWRRFRSLRNSEEYNPTQGQQIYEQFCTEYIPNLSRAFALKPEMKWDNSIPKLAMQRQLLYLCIYDSICWHFRPLLLLKPNQIAKFPMYKQVLLQSQKKLLAVAALKELEAVAALHAMFNAGNTSFGAIIFNTFEACVLILTLCAESGFPADDGYFTTGYDLGLDDGCLNRTRLIQAVERGLERLQMLAEINESAASGAETLAEMLPIVSRDADSSGSSIASDTASWSRLLLSGMSDIPGFDSDTGLPMSFDFSNACPDTESLSFEEPFSDFNFPFVDLESNINFQ